MRSLYLALGALALGYVEANVYPSCVSTSRDLIYTQSLFSVSHAMNTTC